MWRLIEFLISLAAIAALSYATQTASQSAVPAQQSGITEQMRKIWPNLPPAQNPAEVARGKVLFESNCTFCHGPEATGGNGGPDLVRSVLVNHDEHGNLIGPTIRKGRPSKGMPGFSNFTDSQINELVAFLHQRNRDARIRFSYRIGNVEVGNAAAGKAYFDEHCAKCHSAQGDLAGIAKMFDSDELQQLWLDPAQHMEGQNEASRETVTVSLPSGQKFSGTLAHIDEFNVCLNDANGYHSFPITPGVKIKVDNPMQAHQELLRHLTDAEMHNVTTYLGTLK